MQHERCQRDRAAWTRRWPEQRLDRAALLRDVVAFSLLALVLRVGFMLALRRVIDTPDAVLYLDLARRYAGGELLALGNRIPPLYPALCAVASWLAFDIEAAGRAVSVLASSLLVVPVYLLAHSLHGKWTARVMALMVCVWPWLLDYGSRVSPEAVSTTLWFLAVLALARALRAGWAWAAAAPLAFFALSLARPEGLLMLLASPFVGLLLVPPGKGRGGLARLLVHASACVLLLALFAWYMHQATGRAAISYRVTDPSRALQHHVVERFGRLLPATGAAAANLFMMTGPFILVFGVTGALFPGSERRDWRLEAALLAFAAVQTGAAVLSGLREPRYIMPVAVVLALWAARGVVCATLAAAESRRWRWLRFGPLGAMLALMACGAALPIAREYGSDIGFMPREYKAAGLWMKHHLEPGLVFSRKPQVGFYADMPTTGPGVDESVKEALARARAAGVRYVVVDERYTARMLPQWQPLLQPENAPGELRLLAAGLSPLPRARIVVYELLSEKEPGK